MKVRLKEAPETHASFFKDQGIENNSIIDEEEDYDPVDFSEGGYEDIYGMRANDFEYYSQYAKEYIKKKYGEDFFEIYGNDIDFCWDACRDFYGPDNYYYEELKDGLTALLKTKNMWEYVDVNTTLREAATIGFIVSIADKNPNENWYEELIVNYCDNATMLEEIIEYIDERIK